MSEGKPKELLIDVVAAAHELKAPLVLISHLAASIEEGAVEGKVALERIRFSADRTLRLVQGLTLSSRVEQTDFGFDIEPINVKQVCESVLHELEPLVLAYGQKLEFYGKSQVVIGSRDLLSGVLFNLIDNAVQHNSTDGLVSVRMKSRSDFLRVCVKDNGPEIASSEFRRLYKTLGREFQPLRGRSGNSGLGLYIASRMAGAMGGGLGVSRTKGGTDFYVDLIKSKQLSLL